MFHWFPIYRAIFRNLRWNKLQDIIPPEIGELKKLTNLWVIQTFFLHKEYLTLLHLLKSSFKKYGSSSAVTENFFFRHLSFNNLKGEIPKELSNLPELRYLYLHENRLTGRIPPELGNLPNLRHLYSLFPWVEFHIWACILSLMFSLFMFSGNFCHIF